MAIILIHDIDKIRSYYDKWESELVEYTRHIQPDTCAFLLKENKIEKGMIAFYDNGKKVQIQFGFIAKPYRNIKNFTRLAKRFDRYCKGNKRKAEAYIVTRVGIHRVFQRMGYEVDTTIFPITARRNYG